MQRLTLSVALSDQSATLEGTDYTTGGHNHLSHNYLASGPARAWFTTHATAETRDAPDGGGHTT